MREKGEPVNGVSVSTAPSVLTRVMPLGPKCPSRTTLSIVEPLCSAGRFLNTGSVKVTVTVFFGPTEYLKLPPPVDKPAAGAGTDGGALGPGTTIVTEVRKSAVPIPLP